MTVWHQEELATLHLGDCLDVLAEMEPDSVDLIVTSPPYFALRSYTDGGEHYDGQIGSEATPQEFLEALWAVTAECVRVLKPSGSLWVNLGDKYAAGHGGSSTENGGVTIRKRSSFAASPKTRDDLPNPPGSWGEREATGRNVVPGFRPKTLMGMPWRYAIGCIDQLGLILRAEVIWAKPNGLPESVTDRVRRSHEDWFHFTKEPRYFSAVDEVREAHVYPDDNRHERGERRSINPDGSDGGGNTSNGNPLGKLLGSVWQIPTEPLRVPLGFYRVGDEQWKSWGKPCKWDSPTARRQRERLWVAACDAFERGLPLVTSSVDHFAAFASEWPRRIILGWSPSGVCVECGEGRRPVVEKEKDVYYGEGQFRSGAQQVKDGAAEVGWKQDEKWRTTATITGYACGCPDTTAPTRPAVVLDPFAGTGTTVAVAKALGRHGVGIDMSEDYLRLSRWRIDNIDLAVKVAERSGMTAPAGEHDGMVVTTLFEEA